MGVQVRVLGGFSVSRDSQEIPASAFGGRLPRKLVRVLLTRHGEHVPTDLIVEALWPRRPPADPPANVKVLVNRARRALGDPGLIVTGVRGYSVPAGDACVVDAEVFQAMVADARAHLDGGRPGPALREFRRALAVWGGDPLPEDTYEDWARPWREALSNAHVETLEGAAVAALHVDDPEAVSLATTAVSAQPLRERANLLLVRAHAARGDRAAAIAAFSAFRHRLADELGLDPSPEAAALHQRLLRAEPLESPIPKPVPVPVVTRQDELPFVGREREVTQIEAALGPEGPGVVVVAGASGAGKSRLLAESALRSRFPVLAVRAFPAARTEPWSLARALLTEALGLDVAAVRAVPDRAVAALADIVPEIAEHAPASAHQPSLAEVGVPCSSKGPSGWSSGRPGRVPCSSSTTSSGRTRAA